MKVAVGPLKSILMNIDSKFNRINEKEHKEYIQKTILEMHQLCTEGITRCVIMNRVDSFEVKKFIEFYYEISKVQNKFLKTSKIDPVNFIKLNREIHEYYDRCFKE